MKVGLLHYTFSPYTVQLANGLAGLVDLTVIHPDKLSMDCDPVLDKRIHIHNFPKPQARYPQNILTVRRLFQTIRQMKLDILHVQASNDPWFDMGSLIARLPPLITTVHDVFPHPGDYARVPGSQYTNRIPYYRSRHLIVHAHILKKQLQNHFNRIEERVSVVPHGELGSYYRFWSGDVITPREPNTLLFFGRIWPYKGLRYLIEAMPLIIEQIPDVKLIIAGRGEELDYYFPNGLTSPHYEILNNYIPQSSVAGLFQRSAVTVLPYIEASQSGVAAIAYAMGTPVIATAVGGLAEMVHHEADGLLIPPRDPRALADAIIRMLTDTAFSQRLSAAAKARCEADLNWSNIARQTVEIYHRVVADH